MEKNKIRIAFDVVGRIRTRRNRRAYSVFNSSFKEN